MTVDSKAAKKAQKAVTAGTTTATAGPAPGSDAHVLAPQKTTPPLDTSKWPLLLKNYSTLNVRTGHYTPIASGSTPLARPLAGESGGRGNGSGQRGGGRKRGRRRCCAAARRGGASLSLDGPAMMETAASACLAFAR